MTTQAQSPVPHSPFPESCRRAAGSLCHIRRSLLVTQSILLDLPLLPRKHLEMLSTHLEHPGISPDLEARQV